MGMMHRARDMFHNMTGNMSSRMHELHEKKRNNGLSDLEQSEFEQLRERMRPRKH